MAIDTSFDFRTDAYGKDPDTFSATLRRYHKLLWSKPLPGGALFDLDDTTPGVLHHMSDLGEYVLSSDTVIPTFLKRVSLEPITKQFSKSENEAFGTIVYTVGGMLVWPANRVGGMMTINGARGLHPRIADRMDLTLECVRRYYVGQCSPLGDVLARYSDFFALFEDFTGYVDYFLLQDMVTEDHSAVTFFLPFDDYKTPSLPKDVDSYKVYRRLSIEFIEARNGRIDGLAIA